MTKLAFSLFAAAVLVLAGDTAQALTNIGACGFVASGTPDDTYVVTGNIATTADGLAEDCITMDINNTTLFLGGFTITCSDGQGFSERGVKIVGVSNVTVIGPGTITDCDQGVEIDASSNVLVKGLFVTGPPSLGVNLNPRPASQGIRVKDTVCPDPEDIIVNIMDNEVENTRCGIALVSADCVNVHRNFTHDNNSDPVACFGILIQGDSDNNNIGHNIVTENGENLGGDAGIRVRGTSNNNVIHNNATNGNCGDGIFVSSTGNRMVKNVATGNPAGIPVQCAAPVGFLDMRDTTAASANKWNKNNTCNTSSGNAAAGCPP